MPEARAQLKQRELCGATELDLSELLKGCQPLAPGHFMLHVPDPKWDPPRCRSCQRVAITISGHYYAGDSHAGHNYIGHNYNCRSC